MAEAHNANFAVAFASGSATYHALLDQLLGRPSHPISYCIPLYPRYRILLP